MSVRLRVWLPRLGLPNLRVVLHQVARRHAYATWMQEEDGRRGWVVGGLVHFRTDVLGEGFRASVRPAAQAAAGGDAPTDPRIAECRLCVICTANQASTEEEQRAMRIFAESLAFAGDGYVEYEDGALKTWDDLWPPPRAPLWARLLGRKSA